MVDRPRLAGARSPTDEQEIGAAPAAQPHDHDTSGSGLVKIDEAILAANATSIIFSIPGTYRSLRVELVCQGTQAQDLHLLFNGDTGANYDGQYVSASGSTITSSEAFGQAFIKIGIVRGLGTPPVTVAILEIPDYASTRDKSVAFHGHIKFGTGTGELQTWFGAGFWRSTAAITQITLKPASTGQFEGSPANTIATLWGLTT